MGQFSWKYADKHNRSALKIHGEAYVPVPDGSILYEPYYEGYGDFQGKDIYELVAEWNRENISEKNIQKPVRKVYCNREEGYVHYLNAVRSYELRCMRLRDFVQGRPAKEMEEVYGNGWKREIGIDIACGDKKNAALKYPIKICKMKPDSYEKLPASRIDPHQGG